MDIPNISPSPIVNIFGGLSCGVFFLSRFIESIKYLLDCYLGKEESKRANMFMTLISITFSVPFFIISSFVLAAGWIKLLSLIIHR
jgi:hypothetical protein